MKTHSKWLRLAAAIGLGAVATDLFGYPDISVAPLEPESSSDGGTTADREEAQDGGTAA